MQTGDMTEIRKLYIATSTKQRLQTKFKYIHIYIYTKKYKSVMCLNLLRYSILQQPKNIFTTAECWYLKICEGELTSPELSYSSINMQTFLGVIYQSLFNVPNRELDLRGKQIQKWDNYPQTVVLGRGPVQWVQRPQKSAGSKEYFYLLLGIVWYHAYYSSPCSAQVQWLTFLSRHKGQCNQCN